ncbi:hypothetical protein RIF29_40956 [Crotalaria pallida]|uniref:Uncharacterized protein n=1 Tax=Crotalaria pallida TaxID=3830 RepID=A0AAN9EAD1_CROPI
MMSSQSEKLCKSWQPAIMIAVTPHHVFITIGLICIMHERNKLRAMNLSEGPHTTIAMEVMEEGSMNQCMPVFFWVTQTAFSDLNRFPFSFHYTMYASACIMMLVASQIL